jgi:hypothetical protein
VVVRWDPEGRADEQEVPEAALLEADALLLEGIGEEEEEIELGEEGETLAVPTGEPVDLDTLDEVEVEVEVEAEEEEEEGLVLGAGDLDEIEEEEVGEADELEGASLEAMAEEEAALDEDEGRCSRGTRRAERSPRTMKGRSGSPDRPFSFSGSGRAGSRDQPRLTRCRVWYSSFRRTTCLARRRATFTTIGARRLMLISFASPGTVRMPKTRASWNEARPRSSASPSEISGE